MEEDAPMELVAVKVSKLTRAVTESRDVADADSSTNAQLYEQVFGESPGVFEVIDKEIGSFAPLTCTEGDVVGIP